MQMCNVGQLPCDIADDNRYPLRERKVNPAVQACKVDPELSNKSIPVKYKPRGANFIALACRYKADAFTVMLGNDCNGLCRGTGAIGKREARI